MVRSLKKIFLFFQTSFERHHLLSPSGKGGGVDAVFSFKTSTIIFKYIDLIYKNLSPDVSLNSPELVCLLGCEEVDVSVEHKYRSFAWPATSLHSLGIFTSFLTKTTFTLRKISKCCAEWRK